MQKDKNHLAISTGLRSFGIRTLPLFLWTPRSLSWRNGWTISHAQGQKGWHGKPLSCGDLCAPSVFFLRSQLPCLQEHSCVDPSHRTHLSYPAPTDILHPHFHTVSLGLLTSPTHNSSFDVGPRKPSGHHANTDSQKL